MWLYFNSNGQLTTILEHGSPARVGSTNFSIFAVFEDITDAISLSSYSATIKLKKPDFTGSSYPTMLMTPASSIFSKLTSETDTGDFNNGSTYYGFLFDFNELVDIGDDTHLVVLDTNGLWKAVVTLINEAFFVQGVATFDVGGSGSEEETSISYDIVTNQLVSEINKKAAKDQVIIVIDSSSSDVSSYDNGQFFYSALEQIIYQKVNGALVPVGTFDVDAVLSTTSEKPVQNKVITNALNDKSNATNLENGTGENSLQQKGNTASGKDSFAQGLSNTASNIQTHAEGFTTQAVGNFAHSEGQYTIAWADISHTEGVGNVVGDLTETTVRGTGIGGHAEGIGNRVLGEYAHAEGFGTTAKGNYSHSNGVGANDLSGSPEIAITEFDETNYIQANSSSNTFYSGGGMTLILSGFNVGTQTYVDFRNRIQAGDILKVIHLPSNTVEQYEVNDIVSNSIRVKDPNATLKWQTSDASIKIELKIFEEDVASGTAYGIGSHVGGFHNVAMQDYQTVIGKYNQNKSNTLFEVGNGTSNSSRSNAFEVYEDGSVKANGKNVLTDELNIKNGAGTSALQQKQDGTSGTFDFTNKNPNATALDPTLTGQLAYGGVGNYAASFGGKSQASGKRSLAEGTTTIAKGNYSHAEGNNSVAYGDDSHAEGFATLSAGLASHTEGSKTQVLTTLPESGGGGDTPVDPPSGFLPDNHRGEASHAEGSLTVVYGFSSHAEGANTIVKGHYAHAEGVSTMAVGAGSKSYGNHTTATGDYSLAGGSYTTANQIGSFAHGYGASTYAEYSMAFGDNTQTVRRAQFVVGIYNVGRTTTLFEVGNGTDNEHRSNAFEVYQDGHAEVGLMGSTNKSVATKGYVDTQITTSTKLYKHELTRPGQLGRVTVICTRSSAFTDLSNINQQTDIGNAVSIKYFILYSGSPAINGIVNNTSTSGSGTQFDYVYYDTFNGDVKGGSDIFDAVNDTFTEL